MRHLNIPFLAIRDGEPPNDAMNEDERYKRLREICNIRPKLRIDNTRLDEMPAILTYLAVTGFANWLILGDNLVETAVLTNLMSCLESKIGTAFKMVAAPEHFTGAREHQHFGIIDRARDLINSYFVFFEQRLVGNAFLFGAREKVLDFSLYVFARWYKELWPDVDFNYHFPELLRVMGNVERLYGVAMALQEQGKMPLFQ
jgi:glutathione S-transferase